MVIGCDGSASQPGIFTEKVHFSNVHKKCGGGFTMYVLKTHGAGKYECLKKSGTSLKGKHYIGPNRYWGTIEYKLKKRKKCSRGAVFKAISARTSAFGKLKRWGRGGGGASGASFRLVKSNVECHSKVINLDELG